MVTLISAFLISQAKLDLKLEEEVAKAKASIAAAGEDPEALLASADACLASSRKTVKANELFRDLALEALAKAWPAAQVPLRAKIKSKVQLYWGSPSPGKPLPPPAGWSDLSAGRMKGCGLDSSYVKAGRLSFKVASGTSPCSQKFRIGDVKVINLSAWVLSDATESDDQLRIRFFREGGDGITHIGVKVQQNLPVWTKVSVEIPVPEGTFEVDVNLFTSSKAGVIWIDDVSLTAAGKELMKNGSFEK